MGSHEDHTDYAPPAADAPGLVLVQPTPAELRRIWTLHHHMWGPALSLDAYLAREAYLAAVPLARDGGNTPWMLTDAARAPDRRPILASCETLRKPALVAEPGAASAADALAHGIASVFTDPQYRGRGYAARMLRELGPRLRTWQAAGQPGGQARFSVLYSDIGKTFYARLGWPAYPSTHLSFAPAAAAAAAAAPETGKPVAATLGYHDLAALCPAQTVLLRSRLVRRAAARQRPAVALVPDLDTLLWHFMREDYMTKHIFGRTPTVRGALCALGGGGSEAGSASGAGRRMWAMWTRGYYGGLETTKGNTLYILHLAMEGEDGDDHDDQQVDAFAALMRLAQAEAVAWHCEDVHLWNPTAAQQRLAARSGLAFRSVERATGSIASLMWYGEEGDGSSGGGEAADDTLPVDWVGNEKYGWF